MLNNPNNEIHTDYRPNDIFKPVNANQLAEAIHYDFVITQEKIDNVIEAIAPSRDSSGYRNVDLGELIIRELDGASAPWRGPQVKPPLNIFISGKLPSDVRLILDNRFLNDSTFIDCSDFKLNGSWNMAVTKDMINIYSAYPYAASSLPGGFNFWSTPLAPLIHTNGISNNGVVKVGAYKTVSGATTDFEGRQGGQVIAQDCLSGSRFTANPGGYWDGYVPFVVYANWMQGGGIVANYGIVSQSPGGNLTPTTSKPGLYQQIMATMEWGCEVVLIVAHAYASSRYQACGYDSDEIRFSNLDEGKVVTIHKNGSVTWKTASAGGGGGGSEKVVLSNFDITAIPLLFDDSVNTRYAYSMKSSGTDPATNWDWARICVIRNGASFITVKEDCPDYQGSISFYYNSKTASFKFKGATELDYYTWGAIFAPTDNTVKWETIKTDQNCRWWTPSNSLYIDYDELVDGVIYTVRVHHMLLPFGSVANPTGSTAQANLFSQDKDGSHLPTTTVFFCKDTSFVPPNYWGSTGKGISGNTSDVYMNLVKQAFTYDNASPSNGGNALAEIARGEMLFVKLNGSIYVMKY